MEFWLNKEYWIFTHVGRDDLTTILHSKSFSFIYVAVLLKV